MTTIHPEPRCTGINPETLMGSIMALMTGYVQSHNPHHKELISNKLCMLLQQMQDSPEVSPSFKTILMRMEVHWSLISELHSHNEAQAMPTKWFVPNTKGAFLC
jgi:hypothetical protein